MAKQPPTTKNTAVSGDGPIAKRLRKLLLKFLHLMSLESPLEKRKALELEDNEKNKSKQNKLKLAKRLSQKRWLTKQMARLGVYNKMNPQQALQLRATPAAKLDPRSMRKLYNAFIRNLAASNFYMTNTYQNVNKDQINTKMNNENIINARTVANQQRLAPRPNHKDN